MNSHPYRDLEGPKRGALGMGEKVLLGLKGLVKFEPLLEGHRFGLDPKNGLPLQERARHARSVAASDSTDNLFKMIQAERDVTIRSILAEGFVTAFRRKFENLEYEIRTSESGMAAISCINERDRFKRKSIDQIKELVGERHLEPEEGRRLIIGIGGEAG